MTKMATHVFILIHLSCIPTIISYPLPYFYRYLWPFYMLLQWTCFPAPHIYPGKMLTETESQLCFLPAPSWLKASEVEGLDGTLDPSGLSQGAWAKGKHSVVLRGLSRRIQVQHIKKKMTWSQEMGPKGLWRVPVVGWDTHLSAAACSRLKWFLRLDSGQDAMRDGAR